MRVWAEVPDVWEEPLKKACRMEGWERLSHYIRELIKKDLKEKGLLKEVFERMEVKPVE